MVPLVATPIYHVVVDDPPAQLPTLAERYPDRETGLVELTVRRRAGRDHLLDPLAELERLFPRCYARDCREASTDAAAAAVTVADTVLDRLTTRSADHPDRSAIHAIQAEPRQRAVRLPESGCDGGVRPAHVSD